MSNAELARLHAEAVKAKEAEIRAKYSHLDIIEGSLVQEEDHPKFKNKIRVNVRCACGEIVERATSDLHTFKGCPNCLKEVKKLAKKQVNALLKRQAEEAAAEREAEREALANAPVDVEVATAQS